MAWITEDIHVKTWEAPQNTDPDMRKLLGSHNALQNINCELLNNASKLTETNERIKKERKKLKEVKNGPTYSAEQRQLY